MDAICGVLGKQDSGRVKAMARAMAHRAAHLTIVDGDACTLAATFVGNTEGHQPVCVCDGVVRDATGNALDQCGLHRRCVHAEAPTDLALNGHFAAVVRKEGNVWWLLRDRLGAKPLYYAGNGEALYFASELKALLASGLFPKVLNLASVDRYLALRCVPAPATIIKGVYKVPPGHAVIWNAGQMSEAEFGSFAMEPVELGKDEGAEALRERLRASVEQQSVDTVLWSAGIDCAALAALRTGARPLFVSLKSGWQDEASRARDSAKMLGLPLKTAKARALSEATFERIGRFLDEPIADAAVVPVALIAEQLGEVGGAAMCGVGADELLGGYPRYGLMRKARGAKKLVPVGLVNHLLPSLPPNAFLRRGGHYLSSIRDNLEAYLSLSSVFDAEERDDLYTTAMKSALHENGQTVLMIPKTPFATEGVPQDELREHFDDDDPARNILTLDVHVGLPDIHLAMYDRLMAAYRVEAVFPYLEDGVVDLATTLPSSLKFGVRSKPLLRQAMKGVLPGRLRMRARRGFKTPQSGPAWRVIEAVADNTITQDRVEESGLFRWSYVEQVKRSASHNVYRRRQFWALLLFFCWYREIMEY